MTIQFEQRIIAFIVSLALFMDALDTTIINTAIPAMAHTLHVNPVDLKIALLSYLLSLAIFIPVSGWIADKYGIKRVFVAALSIFTVSSFWCGYAHTLLDLVVSRSLQGVGGALMLPLSRLIILRTFRRHELVQAMNAVVIVISLGLMLGPLAGGLITDHFSWPWIFWVNIPFGILAIFAALRYLKETLPQKVPPFDVVGFILFGGGLSILIFSLSNLSELNADIKKILLMMGLAVGMIICYFFYSYRKVYPIIKTELLRIRTFQISILGNLCSRLGFGAVPFLLPLLFQITLNFSAQLAGALLVPIALGILFVKYISFYLLQKFGYKRILFINTLFIGFSLWSFYEIHAHISLLTIGILTFIFGILISMQFSAMNSLAYADIVPEDLSAASSIVSTVQQLSQSFGVALGALLLRLFSVHGVHGFLLTSAVFQKTFFTMGMITFLSAIVFIRLRAMDGCHLLKEAPESE